MKRKRKDCILELLRRRKNQNDKKDFFKKNPSNLKTQAIKELNQIKNLEVPLI